MTKTRILFLCTGNSCRSQMAEGWLRQELPVHRNRMRVLVAIPITIQVYFNSMFAYWINRKLGVDHSVAGPSALIGASNFFELAVATAIALFGFESGAALATVVGVLVEVPVMLSVVAIVNRSKVWYESGVTTNTLTVEVKGD